jgi:hypothetical protein
MLLPSEQETDNDRPTTMTASSSAPQFDSRFQPRERNRFVSRLSLRQRSADHPMAMFSLVATVALSSMAFLPTSGPVLASFHEPVAIAQVQAETTEKTARLPERKTDTACEGQVWGAESETCLAEIARESGKSEGFRVRKLAAANSSSTPTVF